MVNSTNLTYEHPTNINGTADFFLNYTSTVTGGLWGYLILLMVFSISFLALAGYNARKAFAAASFSTFVTTVVLTSFGVVGGYAFTLSALMVALSVLINQDGGRFQ